MASKVLMGCMPEIMEVVLNNLNDEIYSLYSCALVSRQWCKMSVPILWQDPFSFVVRPSFISKYLSSLNEDEKFILNKGLKQYGVKLEFFKTVFEYTKFLKVLDLSYLENQVKKWINLEIVKSKLLHNDPLINHIVNLLFKLFIESGATLHKLDLDFTKSLKLKPEIFCTLGQNVQFFSRIQQLSLGEISDYNIESAIILLRALAKSTTKISALKIEAFNTNYELQISPALIYVINSQEHLRLFKLVAIDYSSKFHGIISALDNQKNSLQEVILDNCNYSAEFKVLNNCKKIETLRFECCNMKLMKLLDYKISNLEIADNVFDVHTVALIFKKSGTLLQRLRFELLQIDVDEIFEETLLLGPLKSFCPNITYLYIGYINFSTQLLELIDNLQNLQFLSLNCYVHKIPEEVLKLRVMQFSKILPLSLQYLHLDYTWMEPYLDIFLNYCNTPIKKLLINRLDNEKDTKAIIEFCVRNRNLNYVGVYEYSVLDLDENIRKEVETYVALVPYEDILVDC